MMGILLGLGIKLCNPLVRRGKNLVARVFAQLHARTLSNSIHRVLEQIEQLADRLSVHVHMSGQRAALTGHTVNASVLLVAVWVADVVLHVADDDVLPVGNIESSVVTDLKVGRAHVAIAGDKQVIRLSPPNIALVIVLERVLLDPEESDSVQNKKVPIVFLGEMITGENPTGADRTDGFL